MDIVSPHLGGLGSIELSYLELAKDYRIVFLRVKPEVAIFAGVCELHPWWGLVGRLLLRGFLIFFGFLLCWECLVLTGFSRNLTLELLIDS